MEVYTILDTTIPIRSLWQMLFGAVLTVGLFINHFMITRKKTRKLWRIQINQGIVLFQAISSHREYCLKRVYTFDGRDHIWTPCHCSDAECGGVH